MKTPLAVSPLDTGPGVAVSEGELIVISDEQHVESEEAVIPQMVPEVRSPSDKEVKEHDISHLPYRNWCKHCVCGKGVERSSTSAGHQPGCIPCVCADYMFMGEKDTSGTTLILVVKDDDTKSYFPNVVPEKGVNAFVVEQVTKDIDLMGHTEILFKTDNEPSIVAVQHQVKANRPHKTVLENSVKGKSKLMVLLQMLIVM
jgi:hypothetical protein